MKVSRLSDEHQPARFRKMRIFQIRSKPTTSRLPINTEESARHARTKQDYESQDSGGRAEIDYDSDRSNATGSITPPLNTSQPMTRNTDRALRDKSRDKIRRTPTNSLESEKQSQIVAPNDAPHPTRQRERVGKWISERERLAEPPLPSTSDCARPSPPSTNRGNRSWRKDGQRASGHLAKTRFKWLVAQ